MLNCLRLSNQKGKANVRKREGNKNQEENIPIPIEPKPQPPKPPVLPLPIHQSLFLPQFSTSPVSAPISPPFSGYHFISPLDFSVLSSILSIAKPANAPKSTHYKRLKSTDF